MVVSEGEEMMNAVVCWVDWGCRGDGWASWDGREAVDRACQGGWVGKWNGCVSGWRVNGWMDGADAGGWMDGWVDGRVCVWGWVGG